jgi:hypothetical protein
VKHQNEANHESPQTRSGSEYLMMNDSDTPRSEPHVANTFDYFWYVQK